MLVRRAPGCTCKHSSKAPACQRAQTGNCDVRESGSVAVLFERAFLACAFIACRFHRVPVKPTNDTFLRALLRQPTEYTPIWLMRQAGRYLPEYNATRRRAGSFLALAKSPELATEVTLQPVDRYGLDAAILFSDILTVPDAMGLGLYFVEGEGPKFERPVRTEADVNALSAPDPDASLSYVLEAVRLIRKSLANRIPLIGFSGSPWTLACYMVEGGGSEDFRTVKSMLYTRPDLMQRLLAVNVRAVTTYLNAQIRAGAQAVMIFDTWGGALTDAAYRSCSLASMAQVVRGLDREHDGERVPCILFTKGGGLWLEDIAATGCDAVGVDWTVELGRARARIGDRCALQGNLDPMILLAGAQAAMQEAKSVLNAFGAPQRSDGTWDGHVFNLGHGISQFTDPEVVAALVETVHSHSRTLRR
jgi:uroporphyrinogen decarboxylase